MKQIVVFVFYLTILSCKSISPHFKRSDLAKNGYCLNFGKRKLKIKSIKTAIVSENYIGLFIFEYDRPPNAEILLPVLRFEHLYFLYKEDQKYIDSVYNAFEAKYANLFNESQLAKIKERFSGGIMFVGHRIQY